MTLENEELVEPPLQEFVDGMRGDASDFEITIGDGTRKTQDIERCVLRRIHTFNFKNIHLERKSREIKMVFYVVMKINYHLVPYNADSPDINRSVHGTSCLT